MWGEGGGVVAPEGEPAPHVPDHPHPAVQADQHVRLEGLQGSEQGGLSAEDHLARPDHLGQIT